MLPINRRVWVSAIHISESMVSAPEELTHCLWGKACKDLPGIYGRALAGLSRRSDSAAICSDGTEEGVANSDRKKCREGQVHKERGL